MTTPDVPDVTTEDVRDQLDALRRRHHRDRALRLHLIRQARTEGCTHHQIGVALGVTEAAVRVFLTRAGQES